MTDVVWVGSPPEEPVRVEQNDPGFYVLLSEICQENGKRLDQGLPSIQRMPVTSETKPGRNEPCFCGSGLKFKKCHGK